ncbi:MAG: 2-amino-4-hydroxy-6-hydroxymethyldihydropteridine diphosphokinase [Gammaproteobacteria bacterium]|nr:2-amino-4-hydroxy-6-hydroxymethyldihydropteridine diphosphokinase [Gammaproteobacteria bacterium]
MHTAYIGLGSNLNQPVVQLNQALEALANLPNTILLASSSFYTSPPLDGSDQPDYVNAVAKIKTALEALELLAALLKTEEKQGRVRDGKRWQARTLDLDLLLFDQLVINTASLILPHPGILFRAFVIYPLLELDENLRLPGGTPLKIQISHLKSPNLQ